MKTNILILAVGAVLTVGSSYWFYQKGRQSVLISEFKVYSGNLTMQGADDRPEILREYFKARFYYLGNRVPVDWLPARDLDFGPSDEELLKGLDRGKGAMMPLAEYQAFLERLENERVSPGIQESETRPSVPRLND